MSLKSKIQSLITAANTKTGETDTNLTDAVSTLIDGYGAGATEPYVEETYDSDGVLIGAVLHGNYIKIRDHMFRDANLTDIALPDTVETIGEYAFSLMSGNNLTSIKLPNSLEIIKNNAFNGCRKLKLQGGFPSTLKKIDSKAFYNCNVLDFTIMPQNLEYIGNDAFYYCGPQNIIFSGNRIITSDGAPFNRCTSLATVQFGSIGNPIIHDFALNNIFFRGQLGTTSKPTEIILFVDTTTIADTESQYLDLVNAPWGGTNVTLTLRNATTGEVITE